MSKKRSDHHRMEHGKHEPQGHGKADHPAKERNDQPDESGHAHPNRHAGHRSEDGHWHPYRELHHAEPGSRGFDLAKAAVEELHEAGFKPEFGPVVQEQVSEIERGIAHMPDAGLVVD
jgi:hypothetical protein